MTFEEFFNKKRIDLVALRAAEPGLFTEFEKHFAQMGEKSFDHTKKYWFNKLRLQYHLAPELKPEKMHQENRLAEQTIIETLTENIPAPSTGFKPRFKPGMANKPTEPFGEQNTTPALEQPATPQVETPAETTAPKPGFKPRFNAKMVTPKPAETEEVKPEEAPATETVTPSESIAAKPGFKPRFNMKTMASKPIEEKIETEPPAAEGKPADAAEQAPVATPKIGFKPRFNAKTMAPKTAETAGEKAEPEQAATGDKPADVTEQIPAAEETLATPKIGFKPRFNAKTTKPQPPKE
jgi:hypothetical protein